MVISRTPFRISFFGGGTDYPAWYREHGGSVLVTTIDKYCYLNCRYLPPFFEHRVRVVHSKIENCQSVEEISHPSVRGVLRFLNITRGIEIHHDGDLPARSGMGSSSAFTVGLINAMCALRGQRVSKAELTRNAIEIEQNWLKENVGSQDQASTAYGGLNHITFLDNGGISVRPVTIPVARVTQLNSHLMLFYTGIVRTASTIAGEYTDAASNKKRQLRILKDMVEESLTLLYGNSDLRGFGEMLHEAWEIKRELGSSVTNSDVEEIYLAARNAGAIGGKLLGAGGGGFMLLYVDPENRAAVRDRLEKLICVPFEIEFAGSQIVFFDPEIDYSSEDNDRVTREIKKFREVNKSCD